MANPQAGDVGTKIRYNAQESLADATVLTLKWKSRKYPHTGGDWVAVLYDTNYAEYTTAAGDLIEGTMEIQLYIETPTWEGHGEVVELEVDENIA